jgi:hypothetical protein
MRTNYNVYHKKFFFDLRIMITTLVSSNSSFLFTHILDVIVKYKVYTVMSNFSTISYIRVITKLPNSEQSYKGKVKTHKYIHRQNQSTTGKLKTVMTLTWYSHLKKWWVESDFKAPNLPLSLRLKGS